MKTLSLMVLMAAAAFHVEAADVSGDLSKILSKLQSMGHGSYTEAEWRDALSSLDAIAAKADAAGDPNTVVEANVIKAMVFSDMKRDYQTALSILDNMKSKYGQQKLPAMKKIYVREADTYSKMGDESAVQRVIQEFEASPNYDRESYPFTVGAGRNTPLSVTRPTAGTAGSISVTAMNVARQQSQFAAGGLFPDFQVVDTEGRERTAADYRGKVLLVDFWARDWTPWKRDLDNLRSFYARYHAEGFEVLGICLEPQPGDISSFLSAQRIAWPQVTGEKKLPRLLGIFGESTNFLLDRNGTIIGRDLRGADMAALAKRALGAP